MVELKDLFRLEVSENKGVFFPPPTPPPTPCNLSTDRRLRTAALNSRYIGWLNVLGLGWIVVRFKAEGRNFPLHE